MALVRWRPYRSVPSIWGDMDRMFDNLLPRTLTRADLYREDWMPRVDISETENDVVIAAEVPGLKKEEINISVEDGVLTLKGERKHEDEKKEKNYHRVERAYGSFNRSFRLPPSVDAEKVHASYQDGVLKVTLPKLEKVKPRAIPIQIEE